MNENELTYSELLYLYADRYVDGGGFLQNKEELPSGKKLNIVKLGNLLSEAAFAYLYFIGSIDLQIVEKKTLGIFTKKVVIATKKSNDSGLTSLEKQIYELSNDLEVHSILYKVIVDECAVPWSVITSFVKNSLVDKQYFIKEEIAKKIIVTFLTYKYHLNPNKNIAFENNLSTMNGKLKEFSQKDFYKELVKEIESGIKAQVERPDTSD